MKKIYFFSYFEITDKCGRSMVWKNGIYSDQRFAYEEAQYIIERMTIPEEISITGSSYVVSEIATLKNG
jgi:ribonuclease R